MAFDLEGWLKKDLGISDDDVALVRDKLAGAAPKIEQGLLRQSDYSRHMDDLRGQQQALADSTTRLEAEIAAWARTQAEGGQITAQQQAEITRLKTERYQLQLAVEASARAAGQDPTAAVAAVLGTTTPPPNTPPNQPPAFDPSKFVSPDQLGSHLNSLATLSLRLPAQLAAISREHHALTGEHIDEMSIISEIEKRAQTRGNQKSLDPKTVWEEMHDIPTKRTAAAEKRQTDLIAAAEARGREAAMTEMAAQGGASVPRPAGRQSPILHGPNGVGRESVLKRPQPGDTVQRAVNAFRTGKYKTGAGAGTPAAGSR